MATQLLLPLPDELEVEYLPLEKAGQPIQISVPMLTRILSWVRDNRADDTAAARLVETLLAMEDEGVPLDMTTFDLLLTNSAPPKTAALKKALEGEEVELVHPKDLAAQPLRKNWEHTVRDATHQARALGLPYAHATTATPQMVMHASMSGYPAGNLNRGSPSADPETNAVLAEADDAHASLSPEHPDWLRHLKTAQDVHIQAVHKDPGYARDYMETHLASAHPDITLTTEGADEKGRPFVNFFDQLHEATGRAEPQRGGGRTGLKITMTGKDGKSVEAPSLNEARLQLQQPAAGKSR